MWTLNESKGVYRLIKFDQRCRKWGILASLNHNMTSSSLSNQVNYRVSLVIAKNRLPNWLFMASRNWKRDFLQTVRPSSLSSIRKHVAATNIKWETVVGSYGTLLKFRKTQNKIVKMAFILNRFLFLCRVFFQLIIYYIK